MNEKELKQKYASDFLQLRKLINSLDLIPGAPRDEFDCMVNKTLGHLYKGSDADKIAEVLASELTIRYGLSPTTSDCREITGHIFEWWMGK